MGGKGRRRREKNYRVAHGGYSRLPPSPDTSQVDALPSKLRKLISFTASHSSNPLGSAAKDGDANKKQCRIGGSDSGTSGIKDGGNDEHLRTTQHTDGGDESTNEKRKKKRKRNQVKDLRFETPTENSDTCLKKRERKKMNPWSEILIVNPPPLSDTILGSTTQGSSQIFSLVRYLEGKKKKHKKVKTEAELDFPGCEDIKFGEVVQAPPKLVAVPKAFKNTQDASQVRIRLQAIEAYRNRKGWDSRPGIQLPPATTSPAL